MNALHQTTQRRLKKIPQIPSVWEGDRRPLSGLTEHLDTDPEEKGDCIIWLDGSEGIVRAMEVVSPQMGQEAMVRTLLRAIENPQNPSKPARPQKIVVRDREIQFFLRGALQNLDIAIDYAPNLPVIDEFFRGFEEMGNHRPPTLPPHYKELLLETAYDIWQLEPWEILADHHILAVEFRSWDGGTLYLSIMGMLGQEYGVLLYRSLESLKQFRTVVLAEDTMEQLEKAFLSQDCWFLNFESARNSPLTQDNLAALPISEIRPLFGSIHPYEGMRPFLDEEEALTIYAALKAFYRFIKNHKSALGENPSLALSKNFRIALPTPLVTVPKEAQDYFPTPKTLSVQVENLPDLAAELIEINQLTEIVPFPDEETDVTIQDDLVPEKSFVSISMISWEWVETLRQSKKNYYQSLGIKPLGEGLPVILIQTSRPKAKTMINRIKAEGGLKSIGFNPGEDPFLNVSYDLGLLQTNQDNFYLFGEFVAHEKKHLQALKKWEKRSHKIQGYCALIVAMGWTGASKGNPQVKDILALFEVPVTVAEDLGMGTLQLVPDFEFE